MQHSLAIPASYADYYSGGGGSGGGTQKRFIRWGSAPKSDPLPFYIPFLTEKVPLFYIFYWQLVPLSQT